MNKTAIALALLAPLAAVGGSRIAAEFGDVTLQGPLGDRLTRMIERHVVAKDPVYLARCFESRGETGLWQTEFWGKYMHGACPLWQLTKCPFLRAKIDASRAVVVAAQDAEGYIGNYTPERRFAPGTWDVWGCKYVLMGLLHHYDMSGDKSDLAAALRLCRYVAKKVGPGAAKTIAHTGNYAGQPSCSILEPVVWLYNRTREPDVLAFADFIVKEMTEVEDGPRLLDLSSVHVADRSTFRKDAKSVWDNIRGNRGKAYEMMSCYQGLIEYFQVTGRKDLLDAAVRSAVDILEEEINLAGGAASHEHWYHGAHHQHEFFPHAQETCVTITWMRLCEKLLEVTGDARYADAFERTFYNAYLASLNRDCDEFAAYTPLSGARSRGHIHCRMHTNCCNENGSRGFVALLRSLVQAKDDEVFLNYYASSRANIRVPATGHTASLEIHTLYPKKERVEIFFRNRKPTTFKFTVRVPAWADGVGMSVNGKPVEGPASAGWISQTREWKDGDFVLLDFALPVRMHRLGDCVAFTRGPILLARDTRFADGDLSEPLRETIAQADVAAAFAPVRSPDPSIWMTFEARLPFGQHDENADGALVAPVRFCDYASAANTWTPANVCRTWLPVLRNPIEMLPKEEN